MKNRLNYQQLSVIAFCILLGLLIIAAFSSSINWIGILMLMIPIVLFAFTFFILRTKEKNTKTLEDGEDWYEH